MTIKRTFKRAIIDEIAHITTVEQDTWEVHLTLNGAGKQFYNVFSNFTKSLKTLFTDPLAFAFKNGVVYGV